MISRLLLALSASALTLGAIEILSWATLRLLGEPGMGARFVRSAVWSHESNRNHVKDPQLLWVNRPGYSDGFVTINRRGFRGRELEAHKPDDTFRVLLLGDSVTFGYRLDGHAIYARKLETILERWSRSESGWPYARAEVLNAGVTGYTSWQARRLYESRLGEYGADLVVAMFGYNDHHSARVSDRESSANRQSGPLLGLLRNTATFELANRVRGGGPMLRGEPVARVGLGEFRENVLRIHSLAAERGARAIFLTTPLRPGVPLVENFRQVTLRDRESQRTVWMRQVDFLMRYLDPRARLSIRAHFFDGAGTEDFTSDRRSCPTVRSLLAEDPQLPILHYLAAHCHRARGELDEAEAAMAESRRLDLEREDMEAYNELLRSMAAEGLIEVLDVAGRFERENSGSLFLDVVHPSAEGHDLIARSIVESVRSGPVEAARRSVLSSDRAAVMTRPAPPGSGS